MADNITLKDGLSAAYLLSAQGTGAVTLAVAHRGVKSDGTTFYDLAGSINLPDVQLSQFRSLSVDSTGQLVTGASCKLYGLSLHNLAGSTRYVKLYNKATLATSSDTPVRTHPVAAGAAFVWQAAGGVLFNLGLSVRCTTGLADNDTGNPSANDLVANLEYHS